MAELNRALAAALAGALCPVTAPDGRNGGGQRCDLWELCSTVCPAPDWKFVQLRHTSARVRSNKVQPKAAGRPRAASRPPASPLAEKVLKAMPRHRGPRGVRPGVLGAQLVMRGTQPLTEPESAALLRTAEKALRPVDWNPYPLDVRYDECLDTRLASATVVANTGAIADPLAHALDRATAMFEAGAYLHWYRQYGTEDDALREAFATVGAVVASYDSLCPGAGAAGLWSR